MLELKRLALIFATTPFMALGVVWQIIAGGFQAGRMLMTQWTSKLALDVLVARHGPEILTRRDEPRKDTKGLH